MRKPLARAHLQLFKLRGEEPWVYVYERRVRYTAHQMTGNQRDLSAVTRVNIQSEMQARKKKREETRQDCQKQEAESELKSYKRWEEEGLEVGGEESPPPPPPHTHTHPSLIQKQPAISHSCSNTERNGWEGGCRNRTHTVQTAHIPFHTQFKNQEEQTH